MIQRIGEEWSGLESTTRRLASDLAAGDLKAVLQAVGKVREAIGALCAANVTRTNFRAAIREALVPILEEGGGELFPAITRQVTDEVTAGVEEKLRALEAGLLKRLEKDLDARWGSIPLSLLGSVQAPSEVPPGVFEKLAAFESRLADLAQQDQALASAHEAQSARSKATEDQVVEIDSRLNGLAEQMKQVRTDVGEVNFRVAELEGRQGQTDAMVLGLSGELEGKLGRAGEAQAQELSRAKEMNASQLHGESLARDNLRAELQSQIESDGSRLEARLAHLDQTLRALFEGEIGRTRADLHSGLHRDLDAGLARVDSSVLRAQDSVRRLEATLPEALSRNARDLEAGFRSALETRLGAEIDLAGARWKELLGQLDGSLRAVVEERKEGLRGEIQQTSQAIFGLLAQLEAQVPAMVDAKLVPAIGQLRAEGQTTLQAAVGAFEARIVQLRSTLENALAEVDERQQGGLTALDESAASRLRSAVEGLESKAAKAREELGRRLVDLEAAVPVAVTKGTGELEVKLQKEMDFMLDNLTIKITELRELLLKVENVVPHREAVASIDDRLVRLEERISRVSVHVESIDSLTPEMRTLADRFASLRDQIATVSTSVESTGKSLGGLKDGLSQGLGELETLLHSGIQRWEEDQSHLLERLSAIRDTLRDQLRTVGDRVEDAGGLLGKLTGRRDGGVRLSRDDWDHVSTKLEGIISGLESILAKKQSK